MSISLTGARCALGFTLLIAASFWPTSAWADVIYVSNSSGTTIGQYDTSGATINASVVSGLSSPTGLAISGGEMFVSNYITGGSVGKYTTSGATINASLISGLDGPASTVVSGTDLFVKHIATGSNQVVGKFTTSGGTTNAAFLDTFNPFALAISGNQLFVSDLQTNSGDGTVGVYDATTGATVNASLVTGLDDTYGMAVSGNRLYVAQFNSNTVGVYDAVTGATINAALVSGLNGPVGLSVFDGTLYVANNGNGFGNGTTVGAYDALTGATVNDSLITGLNGPWGIVVIPEPTSLSLLAVLGTSLLLRSRTRG